MQSLPFCTSTYQNFRLTGGSGRQDTRASLNIFQYFGQKVYSKLTQEESLFKADAVNEDSERDHATQV